MTQFSCIGWNLSRTECENFGVSSVLLWTWMNLRRISKNLCRISKNLRRIMVLIFTPLSHDWFLSIYIYIGGQTVLKETRAIKEEFWNAERYLAFQCVLQELGRSYPSYGGCQTDLKITLSCMLVDGIILDKGIVWHVSITKLWVNGMVWSSSWQLVSVRPDFLIL